MICTWMPRALQVYSHHRHHAMDTLVTQGKGLNILNVLVFNTFTILLHQFHTHVTLQRAHYVRHTTLDTLR